MGKTAVRRKGRKGRDPEPDTIVWRRVEGGGCVVCALWWGRIVVHSAEDMTGFAWEWDPAVLESFVAGTMPACVWADYLEERGVELPAGVYAALRGKVYSTVGGGRGMREPRAMTADECRDEFLGHLRDLVTYYERNDRVKWGERWVSGWCGGRWTKPGRLCSVCRTAPSAVSARSCGRGGTGCCGPGPCTAASKWG